MSDTSDIISSWDDSIAAKIEKVGMEGLWMAGEHVITVATNQVPLLSGTLRRSATVTQGKLPDPISVYNRAKNNTEMKDAFKGQGVGKKGIYISYNTPYAHRVHEGLGIGTWSEPGTGSKYLENAFNHERESIQSIVEAVLKQFLDSGGV